MNQPESKKKKSSGLFWMLLPAILLGSSVAGWIVMVSMALDDPGFSVEPDYYKKAAGYDEVIARRAENERLGLAVEVASFDQTANGQATLTLTMLDRHGSPASDYTVTASAFPIARGNDVQELSFHGTVPGVYETTVDQPRKGLWEVRLKASKGAESFAKPLRTELVVDATDPS